MLAALLAASACARAPTRAERAERAIERALGYLDGTDDELGLDVLLAVRAYGAWTGDRRAEPLVAHRLARMPRGEVERYGAFLDVSMPPPSRAPAAPTRAARPGPSPDEAGELGQRCAVEALDCRLDQACRAYVEADDQRGYALTHQVFVLVVAQGRDCDLPIDEDARRGSLAARLRDELAGAHGPVDDLFAERLAMLAQLGGTLEPAWIDRLLDAQQPEGCFPSDHDTRCHPHATGLALWALAGAGRERALLPTQLQPQPPPPPAAAPAGPPPT